MLDKSGNDSHASLSTTAAKPTYRTDGALHWLEYDGSDLLVTTYSNSGAFSAVLGFMSEANSDFIMDGGSTNSSSLATVDGVRLYSGDAGFSAPYTLNTNAILTGYFNQEASYIRVNGSQTDGAAGTLSDSAKVLGISGNQSSFGLNGKIYGVIMRDGEFSAVEVGQAEQYLANKAGVTLP